MTTGDIDVVFQPIVDLRTGMPRGLEALVRCKWQEYKNPVDLFVQAGEEHSCGRVGRLIREVTFERGVGMPLFVNIHPEELESRWLVRPDDPLCFHDDELFLEITESATFEQFDLCHDVLKEVCARTGAHLAVDDLGAGFSNLERIVDLEPKIVKLDHSLVRGIEKNPRKQILISHLVRLSEDLGARVVVEGIETMDELSAVLDTGAHFGQGYLLARPSWPTPAINWPVQAGSPGGFR
ncbi:MAG TPA: EAL domain-containing protein [Polyangia bacterium]|nr:EAL domain-containing protein [Polyangia bacterium]